jgi:hypothetical protein
VRRRLNLSRRAEGLEAVLAATIEDNDRVQRLGDSALRLSAADDGVRLSWVSHDTVQDFLRRLGSMSDEVDDLSAVAFDSHGQDVIDRWSIRPNEILKSEADVAAIRVTLSDGSVILWQALETYSDTAVLADSPERGKAILAHFLDRATRETMEKLAS